MKKNIKKIIVIIFSLLIILLSSAQKSYVTFAAISKNNVPITPSNVILQNNLLNNLKKWNKSNIKVTLSNKKNGQFFISGVLSDKKSPSAKTALTFLEQNKTILGLGNVLSNYKENKLEKISSGYTHIKLNQYIAGLPVKGGQVTVHYNKEGIVTSVTGNTVPSTLASISGLAKSVSKSITVSNAISIAKNQFNFTGGLNSMASPKLNLATKNLEKILKTPPAILSSDPTANKIIIVKDNTAYAVYSINIKYTTPKIGNWNVYVEISSGKVIDKQSNIRYDDAPVKGTGIGVDGTTKILNLDLVDGQTYSMKDLTKPMDNSNNITTLTANYGDGSTLYNYYNSTGKFVSEYDKALVDAHYNAGVVYDFYKNLFNRNSIDGEGMTIYSVAHLEHHFNNAFWDGSTMYYGDGDGSLYTYLSGDLDIVGHEMTHGVTQANGDLYYHNQSGALNESMSDVFGVLIETYNKYNVKNAGTWKFNAADWVIGDDIYTPNIPGDALRSLADPTLYNQPGDMDNYSSLPDDDDHDSGGVHINSGIPNKAAYLIAESIGMEKTAKIYYGAYNYFNYTIDFKGAANAIIQSATDLYGENSSEVNGVKSAFRTVKVYDMPAVSVLFNSQGGSSVSDKSTDYNTSITAPSAPTKTGYIFGGWYKDASCLNVWNFTANKVIANTTLYAKWIVIGPAVPTNLKASSSSYSSINVSFSAVTGASKYEVYRATSSTGTYALVATTTSASYNNTGLGTNITYYYKVKAYKMIGTVKVYSGFSTVISSKPIPASPVNVKATRITSKSVKLTLSAVTGANGYEVYRATSSNSTYILLTRITNLYYTNSALITGKTYYYKVRAYRYVGKIRVCGNCSTIVHAKP